MEKETQTPMGRVWLLVLGTMCVTSLVAWYIHDNALHTLHTNYAARNTVHLQSIEQMERDYAAMSAASSTGTIPKRAQ